MIVISTFAGLVHAGRTVSGALLVFDRHTGEKYRLYKGVMETGKSPSYLDVTLFNDPPEHYVGYLRHGEFEGEGTLTSSLGFTFKGQWHFGLPDGDGTLTFTGPSLDTIMGRWVDGCYESEPTRHICIGPAKGFRADP